MDIEAILKENTQMMKQKQQSKTVKRFSEETTKMKKFVSEMPDAEPEDKN